MNDTSPRDLARILQPQVVGMSETEATTYLQEQGVTYRIKGAMGTTDYVETRVVLEVDPDTRMIIGSSLG